MLMEEKAMSREVQKKFEDYAYVLDYMARGQLSGGRPSYRTELLVQLIGESFFTLLEAVPRSDTTISGKNGSARKNKPYHWSY
jgi:predicted nucleic acid-binding OB-fold protein